MAGRTAISALIAVGTSVAQDLRDAEGLTRPLLRRAALRLSLSPRAQLWQLGSAYLRIDPPTPDDISARPQALEQAPARPLALPAPGAGRRLSGD